jgi:hypothetical protein
MVDGLQVLVRNVANDLGGELHRHFAVRDDPSGRDNRACSYYASASDLDFVQPNGVDRHKCARTDKLQVNDGTAGYRA